MAVKRKAMTPAEREFNVNKVIAICWDKFCRGAELPVDDQCMDRALKLGALGNIRKNIDELSKFGETFAATQDCSLRAGRRAHFLATRSQPEKTSIDADIYEDAIQHVARSIERMAKRSGSGEVRVEGVLC